MTPGGSPTDAVHRAPDQSRLRTLILLLILLGVFCVWWKQRMPLHFAQRAPHYVAPARPHIRTEQEWITGQIVRQLAATAAFAKTGKGPRALRLDVKTTRERPENYQIQARLEGTELPSMQLDVHNYLWDPDNFTGLVKQLIGLREGAPASPRSATDREIFQRLVRPMPDVLVLEDKRLSEALTRNALDPELHEQAALLIGSFALRHAAGCFYDVRRELSSMTAHLAIARALDKNSGACGELAEAILATLCGRQSAALQILQRLERNRDTTAGLPLELDAIWSRALTMRNTGDYRKLDQPEHASLLERLEYVRALRYSISSEAASNFLVRFPAERLAEWSNIVLIWEFSVSEGHLWAPHALANELDEIATEYRAYTGKRLKEEDITAALNTPANQINEDAEHGARIEVLGWGMWAGLHQRQFCELLDTTWAWMQNLWGVPKQAAEFKAAATKHFSGLELFPLAQMEAEDERAMAALYALRAKLWQEKPELVSFGFWNSPTSRLQRATAKAPPLLRSTEWFSPTFPLGTLYDAHYRGETILPGLPQAELDKLKAAAPYNPRVLYHHMQKAWRNFPTPDQMAAQFEAVRDYDAWSMEVVANGVKSDPDRYEAAFAPLCRLNPNLYFQLGDYLREHKRDEAAVRAYRKGLDLAPNRVLVSNNIEWLVDYFYTHNRVTEAFDVAKIAADVYSARGLITMAQLCERAGRLVDAEEYFRKQAERYEGWEDLALFYNRQREHHPEFAAAFKATVAKIFPQGEESADRASMNGVPTDGVVLSTSNQTTFSLGMPPGDVVVAVNGVRVRDKGQYAYKLHSAQSPKIDFIVWSKRGYRLVTADLPNHRLGVNVDNFRGTTAR